MTPTESPRHRGSLNSMGGPVGRSSTHGEGTRSRVRTRTGTAGDDGLYEDGDRDGTRAVRTAER